MTYFGQVPADTAFAASTFGAQPADAPHEGGTFGSYRADLPLITLRGSVLELEPNLYFILNESGEENPVDTAVNTTANLNAPYLWDSDGPLSGFNCLTLSGGSFSIPRLSLPGQQTRMAFVKLTSAKSSATYEGDASLTIMGDTDGETWDSFGITDGKVTYNRFNNTAWQSFSGATDVNDGLWHMVGMTYDSNTQDVTLFVDGEIDGTGVVSAHQNKGGIVQFGRGFSALDNFVGSLAELVVLSYTLTPLQIANLWTFV